MSCGHFWTFFGQPKWAPWTWSARLCTGQSRCGYKEEWGKRTKREIATQRELVIAKKDTQIMDRACLCLSLHLVSPWRNFTLRELRKLRGSITSFLPAHSAICDRRGAGTSSCKVGPDSGAHFLLYVSGANPSCFGLLLGFIGCAHLSGQDCRETP